MITKALAGAAAKPLILSILSSGEAAYGDQLIQRIEALSGGTLQWNDGTLYPVLHRLEDQGRLSARGR